MPWTAGNLGSVTKFASCLCASLMSESLILTTRLLTADGRAGAPVQKDAEKVRVAGTLVEEVMGLSSSRPEYETEKNNLLALLKESLLPEVLWFQLIQTLSATRTPHLDGPRPAPI